MGYGLNRAARNISRPLVGTLANNGTISLVLHNHPEFVTITFSPLCVVQVRAALRRGLQSFPCEPGMLSMLLGLERLSGSQLRLAHHFSEVSMSRRFSPFSAGWPLQPVVYFKPNKAISFRYSHCYLVLTTAPATKASDA